MACPSRCVELNKLAVWEALKAKEKYEGMGMKVVVNGSVGPRGDGYSPKEFMTEEEAEEYHWVQVCVGCVW